MEKVIKIEWTDTAKIALKSVFDFHVVNSERSAYNIVDKIVNTVDAIVFSKQYQIDDINPNYRRMISGHYKILYKENGNTISIMNIVSTKANPNTLKKL